MGFLKFERWERGMKNGLLYYYYLLYEREEGQ